MMRDVKSYASWIFRYHGCAGDEDDGFVFVTEKFTEQRDYYASLDDRYDGHKYPDRVLVQEKLFIWWTMYFHRRRITLPWLSGKKKEDELFDNKEAMSNGIENFFKTQVTVFDQAVQFEKFLHDDLDRIAENEEAHNALNVIRLWLLWFKNR